MPLPETIEKTYLPGDQVDATELNAMQFVITANHARLTRLDTNELQWIAGKIIVLLGRNAGYKKAGSC